MMQLCRAFHQGLSKHALLSHGFSNPGDPALILAGRQGNHDLHQESALDDGCAGAGSDPPDFGLDGGLVETPGEIGGINPMAHTEEIESGRRNGPFRDRLDQYRLVFEAAGNKQYISGLYRIVFDLSSRRDPQFMLRAVPVIHAQNR